MGTIYITGYSGVGKTMIGRLIASRKEVAFLDTNKRIVEKENKTINDIFVDNGEDYFHRLEKDILKSDIRPGMIVSLGSYIPQEEENRILIKRSGKVIYLRANIDTIYNHLTSSYDKRPYLKNNFTIFTLEKELHYMAPYYEEIANYIVDIDGKSLNAIFKEALAIYNFDNKVKYHIYIK